MMSSDIHLKIEKLLEEYKYQQSGVVRSDQAKGPGGQFGADFFLAGDISSKVAESGNYKVVTYQINMNVTNITTSEITWVGQKLIKKKFKRSGNRW